MRCCYPANSEHEYLWWFIQEAYLADNNRDVEPLYKAENEAWQQHSDSLYEQAHQRRVEAQQAIQQRRWRREDILKWLYFDTLLRQEEISYPDVYEQL